ncbi:acid protease [Aureobasidium pullulans]|uniref:Acid protease n=1 Tax=Aureobasidium pullulans TaxID=5580 RepID=A0A4S8W0I1_AURPU|nr:acid protease [Aureobasidium pullulans]THW75417.1 acid protease [Aureobasidium pullulans]THX44047.1 acid protease [Aureobasidium pullulans]THY13383.1 acid protease [Aureobasidium pullulans]TIA37044.1 acid protease [Aureobasidium pullulans]
MRFQTAALSALFLESAASYDFSSMARSMLPAQRLEKRANTTEIPLPINVEASQYWDGADGPWPLGCPAGTITGCEESRGELFLTNQSLTWVPNSIFQLGLPNEMALGLDDEANYGFDTVTLGWQGSGLPTVQHSTIANMATFDFWLGTFGINPQPANFTTYTDPQPSFMTQLKNNNTIPSLSWGYTAGNQYRFSGVYGSLVLGGYDQSKFEPTNLTIPFGSDVSRDLLVGVQSITTGSAGLSNTSDAFYALIDSTVAELWLPESVCTAFENAFGLVYDEYYSRYIVNDTMHQSLLALNKSITLTLGQSNSGGQTVDITLPYAAMDLEISYPYVANSTRYFPLRRAANDTQYTLGRAFLQEAYVAADYERRNFTVAPCVWEQNSASDIRTILSTDFKNPNSGSGGISGGAIAGIVIGVLAIIAILAGALWFMRRKKQQKKHAAVELEAKSLAAAQTPSGPSSPVKEDPHAGISTPTGGELDSSRQIHEIAGASKPTAAEMDAPWRGELDAAGGHHEFYGKLPQNTFEMEGNNEPIFEMDATATQLHELEPDTRRQSWDSGDDRGDEKRYLQMQGY